MTVMNQLVSSESHQVASTSAGNGNRDWIRDAFLDWGLLLIKSVTSKADDDGDGDDDDDDVDDASM